MADDPNATSNSTMWICRFHPTDGFHEVGCPHQEWTVVQLREALISKKRFEMSSKFPERALVAESRLLQATEEITALKAKLSTTERDLRGTLILLRASVSDVQWEALALTATAQPESGVAKVKENSANAER